MKGKLSLNMYVLKSNKVICFYPVYDVPFRPYLGN